MTILFTGKNLPLIVLAAILLLCNQLMSTARLNRLLRTADIRLPFFQTFQLTMIGNFFNVMTPGMTGGDLVKGYYLYQSEKNNKGRSAGTLVLDRFMGLLAALFLTCMFTLYFIIYPDRSIQAHNHGLRVIFVLTALVLVLLSIFAIVVTRRTVRDKIKSIIAGRFENGMLYRVLEGLGGVTRDKSAFITALILSAVIQVFSLSGILVLGYSLTETLPNIFLLMGVSSIVFLVGAVPVTIGNIGWTELLGSLGWSAVGSSVGGTAFLFWRIIAIVFSLPGGLFYLMYSRAMRKKEIFHDTSDGKKAT